MRYGHIIHYFNSSPWAILPEKLFAIIDLIELKAAGLTLSDTEIAARIGPKNQPPSTRPGPSSIAVLPIFGTISHRASLLKQASGGMSVEDFAKDFRSAVRDPDVAAIVLDVDSPGGSTSGIEELADEIYSARGEKRIIAVANSMAASAAYWIAASAHEIAVTPSGYVGSIGVIGTHLDFSEKAKREGVTVTIISSSKFKAEGSEFSPMSDDARAHLQALVDDRHRAFIENVARGRAVSTKTVREGYGQGRVFHARGAMAAGMVDSIETFDQVVNRVARRVAQGGKDPRVAQSLLELDALEAVGHRQTAAEERRPPLQVNPRDPAYVRGQLRELEDRR